MGYFKRKFTEQQENLRLASPEMPNEVREYFSGGRPLHLCTCSGEHDRKSSECPASERRVGCETSEGLVRIHFESETCEVCAPKCCGGLGYTLEKSEDGETMVGCVPCSIRDQEAATAAGTHPFALEH